MQLDYSLRVSFITFLIFGAYLIFNNGIKKEVRHFSWSGTVYKVSPIRIILIALCGSALISMLLEDFSVIDLIINKPPSSRQFILILLISCSIHLITSLKVQRDKKKNVI